LRGLGTVFVIPDTHVPYHNKRAFELALRAYKSIRGKKQVVIIGDFADFYSVSSHSKDPERRHRLLDEIHEINKALDQLEAVAGKDVTFIEGNHEDRLRRYIWDKAPELSQISNLPGLLHIPRRKWGYIRYRDYYKIGVVTYTHDLGRSGKHSASQSLTDFGGNLVFGHSHRGAVVYQGEAKGASHFCMNVGWLGDVKQVDYMHRARAERDWQTGFGVVDYGSDGMATASFVPIVGGKCTVHGREIK